MPLDSSKAYDMRDVIYAVRFRCFCKIMFRVRPADRVVEINDKVRKEGKIVEHMFTRALLNCFQFLDKPCYLC